MDDLRKLTQELTRMKSSFKVASDSMGRRKHISRHETVVTSHLAGILPE
jgi:hypothetical protein